MGRFRRFLVRFAKDRRGVSAIVVGLSLTVILGFAGLAVDVGLWYGDRRAAQGAADSAAYSAAVDFSANSSSQSLTNSTATAVAVAAKYGFVNGANGVTVTVNDPPASGKFQGASGYVEVIITKQESLFFSALYLKAASISARAVASYGTNVSGNYCMEILNNTPGTSNVNFNITNGATIDLSSCGIADNGPGSCAISASGGANILTQSLSIVGNYCTYNGATVSVSGTKTIGAQPVADPYAGYTVSSVEGSTNMSCPNSTPTSYSSSQSTTINPGVYCGGFSVSNSAQVTMNPGVYYVVGGTFSLAGGTTTTGTGVTIILTGSGSNYATANIANGVDLNLTAPTSGPTAGVALWADAAGPTTNTSYIAGGASMNVNGALYLPTQTVSFSNGSSNSSACTQLIAYNVTFQGGANFTNKCASNGIKSIGTGSAPTIVE